MDDQKVSEMKSVYDIIMRVRAAKGNEKLNLLTFNKGNVALRHFLYLVYEETKISYYQTKIKPLAPFGFDMVDFTMDTLDEIVITLADRKLTGKAAVQWLGQLYGNLREEWMRELLTMLIDRDVKAGVKVSTVNKVWSKLVTDEPYMRCTLPKKVDMALWPWARGIDIEVKYDGTYANIFIALDDSFKEAVKSRNGSEYNVGPFKDVLDALRDGAYELAYKYPDIFKDEEYIVFNGELEMLLNSVLMPRAEGNGKFNSMLKKGEVPNGCTIQYKVWDFVPGTKFEAGYFGMLRRQRKAALDLSFVSESRVVEIAESTTVHSYGEAIAKYKYYRTLKLEGAIAKHPDGPWENGTSVHQVKLKNEAMFELELVKFNVGSGKNAELFGSITFKSCDGLLEVDATGFTDELRQWFHDNRDTLPGTIHTLIGNELTKPKKSGQKWSVFLPRWDHQRLDKTKADSLDEIIKIFESVIDDE